MALLNLSIYKWWHKVIRDVKGKEQKTQEPQLLPPQPIKPLSEPVGKLFYLDFICNKVQENTINEVTTPSEQKIDSEISHCSPVMETVIPIVNAVQEPATSTEIPEQKTPQEEFEWPQDKVDFINSFCRETWTIPQPHQKDAREKYGYDKPLVIKVINMLNPGDFKIFISVKQLCETLSIKPKKVYSILESESRIFNSKYKLEIIPFPMDEEKFTVKSVNVTQVSDTEQKIDVNIIPKKAAEFLNLDFKVLPIETEFSSGTKLQMRVKNMRKHKFVSVADKCPQLVKEWDELNNGISADKVPHALKENAFWICQICGKHYERRIDNRTRRPEPGCTKCVSKKTSK